MEAKDIHKEMLPIGQHFLYLVHLPLFGCLQAAEKWQMH
jgi:hypothetical protein